MSAETPFQIVNNLCKDAGISVILIGGYALGAYDCQRFTMDVDFMVDEQYIGKISTGLANKGYQELLRTDLFIRYGTKNESDIIIDFLLINSATFKELYDNGQQKNYGGFQFCVPKLEHLIALKLHALNQQFEKRKTKDLPDILELIRKNNVNAKTEEFHQLCLKFGNEELYKRIIALV